MITRRSKSVDRMLDELERRSKVDVRGRIDSACQRYRIDSVDRFMEMTHADWMELEGIGEKTAGAAMDIQTRIKNREARHVTRSRSIDPRNRSRDSDTTHRTVSPLTLKIEKLIGGTIAGTTDEVINDMGFTDLGLFLMITPDYLIRRGVSVLERGHVSDIQNKVRDRLFKQSSNTYYSDNLKLLLVSDPVDQEGARVITSTVDLELDEIYLVDRQKHAVARIDLSQFTMAVDQKVDAALLNRIADHYKCWVCNRTLAMVIGKTMLARSR